MSRLAPRLVSVLLAGPALDGFSLESPTAHIKVFLPAPGQQAPALPELGPDGLVWPEPAARPIIRTYTPRRYDPAAGILEVQFVLHGTGAASAWAEQAAVGDQIAIAGPGGRFRLDPQARHWWIGGDESALPAIATLLEALPPSAAAEVHLEAAGPADEIDLASPAQLRLSWHHRRAPEAYGVELADALRDAALPAGARVWVACEAAAMRGLRRQALSDRGLPPDAVVTRGYWRRGTSDYPDHDYGEDT
ncbi:siderophore-interacting protein [Streptomyces sp. NY05-11A]|uniref:siderophore-interacting protein n=1 Tax=Streptomyces soliscabiei TaxID=588897 RepID=UPI0029BEFC8C|nr:siderophore-interacting protein [Streptomyces sp. NY05-11A]MDX2683079.1 siderophore-interacting protein [Streptomyces sp. NY05-11A]